MTLYIGLERSLQAPAKLTSDPKSVRFHDSSSIWRFNRRSAIWLEKNIYFLKEALILIVSGVSTGDQPFG